jgi:hypothetical protein
MYHKWYNQDHYQGIPIDGGITKMEALPILKWRKHFLQGQKKYFNQVSVIVRVMDERVKQTNMSIKNWMDGVMDEGQWVGLGKNKPRDKAAGQSNN